MLENNGIKILHEKLKTKINFSDENFGLVVDYYHGDCVVWKGIDKCIAIIDHRNTDTNFGVCYYVDKEHNSLHYKHLRYATDIEKKMLGNNKKLIIRNDPN